MKVTAIVGRRDVLRLNAYLAPRQQSNWILFGILWAFIFIVMMFYFKFPLNLRGIGTGLASAFGGAVGGTAIGLTIQIVQILVASRKRNGILGEHHYEIQKDGLFERTEANEGLAKWSGIERILKPKRFIVIGITGFLFHIIPRSAFKTEQEFEQFFMELRARWQKAV